MVDVVTDHEGFSQRSGVLPSEALANFCYENDKDVVKQMLRGKVGLYLI